MSKFLRDSIGTVGGALFIVLLVFITAALMNQGEEPKTPTYHCDGTGYPDPGTPEARACWIER